jgi:hypothetical protein
VTKNKKGLVGGIVGTAVAIAVIGGCLWLVKSFLDFGAELNHKDEAEFTAIFGIPTDAVGADEFEVRKRNVNSRLHLWATQLDEREKACDAARKAIYDGIGANYSQDLQAVKLRRDLVENLDAKLSKDRKELEHKVELARNVGYSNFPDVQSALAHKADQNNWGEEAFD